MMQDIPFDPSVVVALASDHAGYALKDQLLAVVEEAGFMALDLGTDGPESVDYPDFGRAMAEAIADKRAGRGVLVCGTGIGISIAANRHPAARAALCHDATTARLCREHNDANVVALGARIVGFEVASDIVRVFLKTEFAGGRHQRRVDMLGVAPELQNS